MKNYYDILELSSGATQDEIKKAYRKLAMDWHPDRHQDKSQEEQKQAEEKFKDIAEAYENLKKGITTSEDTRSVHFNGDSMDDIMNHFRNMGFGFNMRNVDPYEEIQHQVTLKNVYNQEDVNVVFTAYDKADISICNTCQGSGRIVQTMSSGDMHIHRTTKCNACKGQGNQSKGPGKTRTVKVKVDSIVKSLGRIGSYNPQTQVHNEVRVRFILQKDQKYKIVENGRSLMTTINIEYQDLKKGITVDIDVLGKKVKVTIPPQPSMQRMLTVPNKGMPIGKNSRGNLYIKLDLSYN